MKSEMQRGSQIWLFTNVLGSLLFLGIMAMFGALEANFFVQFSLLGTVVSAPSIFFSALSIRLLRKLPPESLIRFIFMLIATIGVIACVILIIDIIFFQGMFGSFWVLEALPLFGPHILMALITSIYFNRDLISVRSGQSLENSKSAMTGIVIENPKQTIED